MKRKMAAFVLTAFLAVSLVGCQPESPAEESSEVQSSVITEDNGITVKSPVKPYFAKLEDFEKKAKPLGESSESRLKKATAALTADTAHYEVTEYNIAENMLGSEVDVITVEVERKDKAVYTKTTKRIVDDITQDEFITIDGQSYRLTDKRTKSIKENMADDVILVTGSMDTITGSMSEAGFVEVGGESVYYEFYEFGNAQIIAYFNGDKFIRADVYLKGDEGFAYKGYFEGDFNIAFDESLLVKP